MVSVTRVEKSAVDLASTLLANHGHKLAQHESLRRWTVRQIKEKLLARMDKSHRVNGTLPGIIEDRKAVAIAIIHSIERGLAECDMSPAVLHAMIKILAQGLFLEQGDQPTAERFRQEHGVRPPTFLVLSPGKACNLRCVGCYADSANNQDLLEWSTVDRIISEGKTLWGARFFVISGGEPMAYRSEGKGILDLIGKHDDCMFMMYTNGTLIDEKVAQHLAQAGNMLPAISLEGFRERTDARRGKGVFDRIMAAMGHLREAGIPFGTSLTATRENAAEILSDEFMDMLEDRGVLFSWIFQYMPIGRSFTLDLLPTTEQRKWMWQRSWDIVRDRKFFLADFWNSATACGGCLSAGGHGSGGYFYIDWNGAVSPCVFVPYAPVNIKDVYAKGGNLNDVWADPFFRSLRQWQFDYIEKQRNQLAPCPNRDHHAEFQQLLAQHEPDPIDENAAQALMDAEYGRGLAAYGESYDALTQDIWQRQYVGSKAQP